MSNPSDNIETARRYLKAIEQGATGATLAQFFAPQVVMELFPNRLAPQGSRSGLAEMLEAAERGQKALSSQHYEIKHEVASGDTVALEVLWVGTLAIPVAGLSAGSQMRAHFAAFLEFRDGKILAQRNYDCYHPW